jgi:hypothetical protein
MKFDINLVREFVATSLARISADTLGWLAAILLHAATVPAMLALINLNIITIGLGFIVQAVMMALVLFK